MHTADKGIRTSGPEASPGTVVDPVSPARDPSTTRFAAWLTAITAAGLAIRWVFTWVARGDQPLGALTDNRWYYEAGRMLASGDGFGNPLIWYSQGHRYVPSAGHPPAYSVFLGAVNLLGIGSPLGARLATGVLGAITITVAGITARELVGDRAGLVAAGLAAIYPNVWINDGVLLSETPFALFVALFLYAAIRCWRRPTYPRVALLSVWIALGALTRSEAVLFYPLCVLPLLLRARHLPTRDKLGRLGLAALVALVVVGPWVAYNNQPGRFANRVFIVSGSGIAMSYGNCDRAYRGTYLGYWHWSCGKGSVPGTVDETVIDAAARDQSFDYIRAHLGEQPRVLAARVGRLFHLYRPGQSIEFDDLYERRGLWPSRLALAMYYPVTLVAIVGFVILWRRRLPVSPFVAVTLVAVVSAASTFGVTRYRVGFDVAAVVLAGIAVDRVLARWRSRVAEPVGARE